MDDIVKVGNMEVTTQVVLLYAHYLQEVVASLAATDFVQRHAVDSNFESLMPHPHRIVVYRRFVGVLSADTEGVLSDAFFVPREEFVPAPVLLKFLSSLPEGHRLRERINEEGFLTLLRDRLIDAVQFGGLRRIPTIEPLRHVFLWLATDVLVSIRFEPSAQVLTVTELQQQV